MAVYTYAGVLLQPGEHQGVLPAVVYGGGLPDPHHHPRGGHHRSVKNVPGLCIERHRSVKTSQVSLNVTD